MFIQAEPRRGPDGLTYEGGHCVLTAAVAYARNSEEPEADRTIVTVQSPSNPFSFVMDEVARGERVYVKDFSVLVTRASDPVTIAEHRRALEEIGEKSVYDRVKDHAEQTLSGAWNDMPIKRPYYFILGLEGGRQRFELSASGDLWANHPNFSKNRPGKDNAHFLWPDGMSYHFGLPASHFADATLVEGYLPIVTTRWVDGEVLYEEEGFADLLAASLNSSPPMQSDDPVVAYLKFRIVNNSPEVQKAHLSFATSAKEDHGGVGKHFETLRLDGDQIMGTHEEKSVLRLLVDTRGAGRLSDSPEGVKYDLELWGAQRTHAVRQSAVHHADGCKGNQPASLAPPGTRAGRSGKVLAWTRGRRLPDSHAGADAQRLLQSAPDPLAD